MRCPFCREQDTSVKDSRASEDASSVRRRRVCSSCGGRFTTSERMQVREFYVLKKNGQKRPFDRDKIAKSINLAIRKRTISAEQVEMMVNKIIYELEEIGDNVFRTDKIGELVMESLEELDKTSYIRYASVYRDFCEVRDFEKLIEMLAKREVN